MDEASVQLSFLQLRSIFHQAEGLNHNGKSPVLRCLLFSPRKQKQQRDGACLLLSFIISVARWRMISVHNNLAALTWSFKMQNYRLGAKRWPQRLFSTVLIVSPSALPDVRSWQYNYCSVGRDEKICCLLSLPPTKHPAALHGLRRWHRTDWTLKSVSVCLNLFISLHFVPYTNKKAVLEWATVHQTEINWELRTVKTIFLPIILWHSPVWLVGVKADLKGSVHFPAHLCQWKIKKWRGNASLLSDLREQNKDCIAFKKKTKIMSGASGDI